MSTLQSEVSDLKAWLCTKCWQNKLSIWIWKCNNGYVIIFHDRSHPDGRTWNMGEMMGTTRGEGRGGLDNVSGTVIRCQLSWRSEQTWDLNPVMMRAYSPLSLVIGGGQGRRRGGARGARSPAAPLQLSSELFGSRLLADFCLASALAEASCLTTIRKKQINRVHSHQPT